MSNLSGVGGSRGGGDPGNYTENPLPGSGGGTSQVHHAGREPTNQRFSNLIHDSEVFLTKLREFKPQSLGCLEARRKSSSTLIFPSPQQACMGPPKCPSYPHNVKPTPGYWIECHGPGVLVGKSSGQSTVGAAAAIVQQQQQQQQQQQSSASQEHRSSLARLSQDEINLLDAHLRSSPFASLSEHQNLAAAASSTLPATGRTFARQDKKDLASNQDELADHHHHHDVLKRRQSVGDQPSSTTAGGDTFSFQQSSDSTNNNNTTINDKSRGGGGGLPLRSASEISQDYNSSTVASQKSPTAVTASAGSSRDGGGDQRRGTNDTRRKLSKRTMTRDDIDLHKARRGTPNITITEPSFNQTTTTIVQQYISNQRSGLARQSSSSNNNNKLKQVDSLESPSSPSPSQQFEECTQVQQQQQQQQQPIKFQLQRYMSNEAQPQFKDDRAGGGDREAAGASAATLEYQDSSTKTDDYSPPTEPVYRDYQHHRPSVIREDIDNETSDGVQTTKTIPLDAAQPPPLADSCCSSNKQQQQEEKELYCGLSTQNFAKKAYQQAYSEQQNIEQFRDSGLELISFEEENYEKHYYGREHWNYFTNDELLGPVMLSLKQEVNNQRDHFHVLLRTVSYTLHGTIPASTICADRYDREAIVRELSEIAKLKPPLMLGQLPSTPDELLKLDHIFIKTELKVGVIYIKSGQEESEEAILGNKDESPLFTEFLDLLGDRITLRGFDRYKGGLDTVHNLTGTESVYTMWRNIEIMFHVSTMLPHEENDPQKLQKKRHIVRTSPKPLKEGEKRKYSVSCVCRNEVQYAFRPYLVEQDEFVKSDYFREWLLVKIVNGERASYSAPKFARMQDRTRSQLLEDIITNLANHLVTGQIPKPYRRGSWRPLGHTRASSPLEDSMKDYFEDSDQLAKDFCNAFCGLNKSVLCDVVFKVKDADGSFKLVHGVRAIMAIRSRTFLEMLYGFVPPGTGQVGLQNQTNLRAIEMKALSGESGAAASSSGGKDADSAKALLTKRGSVGTDSSRKIGEKERRQSMLPNISKTTSQKPNYLTVPNTSGSAGGGAASGGSTGGMIKNAFNRLVSGNWSGWSGNIKGYKGEPMHIKVDQNKTKVDLNSLAICKEIAKIDADKLTRREFEIKEFDYETFQQTIEYIHNGQCKLSYETIPGLICAAEHYDLPDLLHACFHHANTHMKLGAAPRMMNSLYQNSCFYITAMQLLDAIYEFIDPHGNEFFHRSEYLELYESVFTSLLCRKSLQITELGKFQAMNGWARQQVANKQQKQLLQRKHSTENQEKQLTPDTIPEQSEVNQVMSRDEAEQEYRNLMIRLNKEINLKLDKISSEDLVKVVLPTKVFSNDKIFEVMADESRNDY